MTDNTPETPETERHEPPRCIRCKGLGRLPTLQSDGHGTYSRGPSIICPGCKGKGRIFVWRVVTGAFLFISSIFVLKGL